MKIPERYRITAGHFASTPEDGPNGAFKIPVGSRYLHALVSDGTYDGWEHVSVNGSDRVPTWDEMCFIKDLFWEDEQAVIQYHPRKSQYINCHPFVLHLWRPTAVALPEPPSTLVGPATLGQAFTMARNALRGRRP